MKDILDIYELSPMQKGMLFHTLYAPKSGVYFEQLSCTIQGDFDSLAFKQAWQQVVERHSVLRTSFHWEELEKTLQVVHQQVDLPWIEYNWIGKSPVEQQKQLAAFLQADRERGFELNQAPLMRFVLIQVAADTYYFVWSYHHLLLDGWSVPIIFKEVLTFYEAFNQGQELSLPSPPPYRDYIIWLQQQDFSRSEMFWQETLQGFTAPTPLVVDTYVTARANPKEVPDEQSLRLSAKITAALQNLAQQNHISLNTIVQGAWGLLLSRYSSESDIVFGSTFSGRPPALSGVESMVGLFINTLPIRGQVTPEVSLLSWLKDFQAKQVELRQYEYSSLIDIQGWSEVPRGTPLFESLFVFENYPVDAFLFEQKGNLKIDNIRFIEQTNYPLTVIAIPGTELSLNFLYDNNRFDAFTITRLIDHFRTLLEGIADVPQRRISELPILPKAERHQIMVEWNDTKTNYPQDKCIHELFEVQVKQTPDRIAVEFPLMVSEANNPQQLTYNELNRKANQLAHYLQNLGVKADTCVGICVERSLEMVIGILGILKAGGAYVPLDPSYPKERLAFMLEDAQIPVLLTQKRLLDELPELQSRLICLDTNWDIISQECEKNPISGVTPENLAYVIYTSGSTGKPKGVAMRHLPLFNLISWQLQRRTFSHGARTLQFTPVSFDVSFQELFSTWCSGGSLVLISEEMRQDTVMLLRFLTKQAIERLFLPFVGLQQLAEVADNAESLPTSLREIITAGEQLQITPSIIKLFTRLPGCTLDNQYGPSESHVVTAYTLPDSVDTWPTLPPIGRPIANTHIYLLDQTLQPVPIGVPGELYIGGISLARGYLDRPELTKERFIADPFSDEPGARLYKTGDLARYLPDGNIEFLGRIDHQVKIRGFRVELGEVEAILTQHLAVKETAVVVREDQPGNKRLVAYVVPDQKNVLEISELRRFLKKKLPDYMIPSAFKILEALPLTPSGKINRRALPTPDTSGLKEEYVAPRTPTEKILAKAWAEILELERVGIYDNFFDLGGHSLLATRLISRIHQLFHVDLPLRNLFEEPNIANLAESIETIRWLSQKPPVSSDNLEEKREEIEI